MKQIVKKASLFVFLLFTSSGADAYDFEVKGIYYGYNAEDQTAYITHGTEKYSGNIVIPESVTYNGRTMIVVGIGSDAFNNCFDLLSVQMPKSITYIGDRAFFDCVNIVSVILSENIISIGDYAFQRCEKLSSIKLPEQLKTIASAAFVSCIGLETLSIPSSVEQIEGSAFADCSGLKSIVFKDGSKQLRLGSNNAPGVFNNDCPLYLYIGRQLKYVESRNYAFGNSLKVLSIGNHLHNETDFALFEESLLWGLYLNRTSSITTIYSMLEEPMNTRQDVFQNEVYLNAKLYVPTGTKDKYLAADGWKNFFNIQEMDVADMWDGNGEPQTEGKDSSVSQVKAEAIMIQTNNGTLNVSGVENGNDVTVYSSSGMLVGSANATSDSISIVTGLLNGEIAIVKIGDRAIKVVMK